MEFFTFKITCQEDIDFTSLMILGLEQVKRHYKPEDQVLTYDEKSKDIDFFGIVNNAATIWSEGFLEKLKNIVAGNEDSILMTKRELDFIKYTTSLYFDYVGDNLGVYGKINIEEKFDIIENKQRSKNILKIVK